MNCPKCGAKLMEGAASCQWCGQTTPENASQPTTDSPTITQPPAVQPPPAPLPPMGRFTCPFCGNQGPPIISKTMSSGGWILFAVLLVFCLPLCWLPFVLNGTKEEVRKCYGCGAKLG